MYVIRYIISALKRSFVIASLLCTAAAAFVGLQVFTAQSAAVLTLETETIPILPPHDHTVGVDSISDDGHHVNVRSGEYRAPHDMWVVGMRYEVHGAPALTLHHGTIFRLDERDQECPEESPRPLVSVSQDQQHSPESHFPDGFGVFIPKGTPLLLDAMFHNPQPPLGPGETYTDVSLQFDLLQAEGDTSALKPLSYHLLRLSDTPCRELSHTFTVPPHTESYIFGGTTEANDASRLRVEEPSRIVYWGAHLHGWEGGKSLTVKKNGEVIEVFETKRSADDAYRFDTPHGVRNIELKPGDVISTEALYENMTSDPLRGAMGHLGLYMAEQ